MIAVLGWATGVQVDGAAPLEHNPWGPDKRRAHGMKLPKEASPNRPSMTDADPGAADPALTPLAVRARAHPRALHDQQEQQRSAAAVGGR
jgi:hypothetical protein